MSNERQVEFDTHCIYVLDTNVLLDILRLGKDLAEKSLRVFDQLKDRIAIPYYVGREYHNHFLEIIKKQEDSLKKALNKIQTKDAVNAIMTSLCDGVRISPSLRSEIIDRYDEATTYLKDKIKASSDYYRELEQNRSVINKLASTLDGKVMDPLSVEKIKEYEEEGAKRYAVSRPPGYKDTKKRDNKYGDYIIWSEILEYASRNNCDICFVSGDLKEDWWHKLGHENLCPRYELQEEFQLTCPSRYFKLITLQKFLELTGDMSAKEIEDVKELIIDEKESALAPEKMTELKDIENIDQPFKEQINQGAEEENKIEEKPE